MPSIVQSGDEARGCGSRVSSYLQYTEAYAVGLECIRGRLWRSAHLDFHILPPHLVAEVAALDLEPLRLVLEVLGLVHKHFDLLTPLEHLQTSSDHDPCLFL